MFNKKEIYFDSAATTVVDEKVVKSMLPYYTEKYGNASSQHLIGQEAKRGIEESRSVIAKSICGSYDEIVFTGSGTEANNFVLKGLFFWNKTHNTGKNHIITSKIEHDCVLNACKWLEKQGARVTYLDVDKEGFIDIEDLKKAISEETLIVSIIHGNNEIGTIQDLEEIGKICKENNVYFHTDACQSYTKVNLNVKKLNLDLVTLNAHKIHGPKGVGALFIRKEIKNKIDPLLHGGGHEFGLRSSTENVAGIVGFATAYKIASNSDVKKMEKLRDYLIEEILKIPNAKLNGSKGDKRLANNINISFGNIEGEALGGYLNAYGISTSTGSACSSHSLEPSHVLTALGLEHGDINSSIRISLSKFNTKEEADYFLQILKKVVDKLRKMSPIKL
ncbi:MAG: cysteine desulfurase family protein [archaeon]